ncbi:UDP-N-acetylglucosamine 2-epimerase (non-hydrolyzing) [Desulfovibrio sp. OttesenSCG-928-G11]|nr:UDP-N-acetylglucosamine 2-epimerase (non-hydrolyzing) [Desulfovibrio sp. OttesenSCG-928-G11]
MKTAKILSLVGARPQFIKEALVGEVARKSAAWEYILIHSGQHYDVSMSDVFFHELGIPAPRYNLGIGSGPHGKMTGTALAAVEEVLMQEKPDALLVYGDTNTTLAGALAAAKLHIPVVHVEAGIRMEPKSMPEEINRVLTDRISAIMCCCSSLGEANLAKEGLVRGVHVTGDVMYDLFLRMRPKFSPAEVCARFDLSSGNFILASLHRDYNVDEPAALRGCLRGLSRLSGKSGLPVLLPLHPRTRKNMERFGCQDAAKGIMLISPLSYLDMMSLVCAASLVLTDSGGLQKEAFYSGKRAVVIMPDTGWRELTDCGWNILSSPEEGSIADAGFLALQQRAYPGEVYGNGDAAQKIVRSVADFLGTDCASTADE